MNEKKLSERRDRNSSITLLCVSMYVQYLPLNTHVCEELTCVSATDRVHQTLNIRAQKLPPEGITQHSSVEPR